MSTSSVHPSKNTFSKMQIIQNYIYFLVLPSSAFFRISIRSSFSMLSSWSSWSAWASSNIHFICNSNRIIESMGGGRGLSFVSLYLADVQWNTLSFYQRYTTIPIWLVFGLASISETSTTSASRISKTDVSILKIIFIDFQKKIKITINLTSINDKTYLNSVPS